LEHFLGTAILIVLTNSYLCTP